MGAGLGGLCAARHDELDVAARSPTVGSTWARAKRSWGTPPAYGDALARESPAQGSLPTGRGSDRCAPGTRRSGRVTDGRADART